MICLRAKSTARLFAIVAGAQSETVYESGSSINFRARSLNSKSALLPALARFNRSAQKQTG
jgi:hypothetical protein